VKYLPIVDLEPLRRYPQFRRLWIGLAISQIGSQLTMVAIFYQVYLLTGSSLDVGLVSLAQLVPALVGSLLGGSVADAVDRRRLLVVTQIAMALCSVGLALNSRSATPALWPIFVLAALSAGFSGADSPARTAIMMNLVPWDSFATANVLRQLLLQISLVMGPALGGLLLARFGVTAVYWIDVASFAAAIAASALLPGMSPKGKGTRFGLRSIAEGFGYLRGRQALQGCFLADLDAMILGMPTALFPAMALEHFHGGPQTVGYLYAAPGVGALVGMLLSGWTARVGRAGRAVVIAIAVWGLAITAFGLSRWLVPALLLLAVAGWADVISAVFRSTILQVEAPDRLRGRLSAIQTAVVGGGPRLGNAEAGGLAALIGVQASVVVGGVGCVAGIALLARLMPRFAGYRLAVGGSGDAGGPADSTGPGGSGAGPR
jgi:MFS family permease